MNTIELSDAGDIMPQLDKSDSDVVVGLPIAHTTRNSVADYSGRPEPSCRKSRWPWDNSHIPLENNLRLDSADRKLVMPQNEISYRPDIDGLRALAVLAVMGFHVSPGRVQGGFVGVDIFFAISGFLITSIILRGIKTGSFSFWNFYSRRVRRIFPALVVVLTATLALGWLILLPYEYKQLGRHVIAGSMFSSNLLLWKEVGYFDEAAEHTPLLHLWSLGIEEQFYLLWPITLIVIWKNRWHRTYLIAGIAIVCFAFNVYLLADYPTATFYAPVTRFWELLIGALLAIVFQREHLIAILAARISSSVDPYRLAALRNAMSIAGIAMIAASIVLFGKDSNFPGARALVPTLGAAMVIAAGPSAWLNRYILSNRVAVYIGLISYPLYLWHWPLLSYVYIYVLDGHHLAILKAAALTVAFLAAAATYRLLETTLREVRLKRLTKQLAVAMSFIWLLGLIVTGTDGMSEARGPWTMTNLENYSANDVSTPECISLNGHLFKPRYISRRDFCLSAFNNANPVDYVVIGDSHANRLSVGMANRVQSVAMFGRGSCLPFFKFDAEVESEQLLCSPTMENLLRHAVSLNPRAIVINAYFVQYFEGHVKKLSPQNIQQNAEMTFRFLASHTKKVIVVLDVPILPFNPRSCISLPIRQGIDCTFPKERLVAQRESYEKELRQAALNYTNVSFVDPANVLCSTSECYGLRNGKVLYTDPNHLSLEGARLVGEYISGYLE
jgi:peptidoglycan/LPS O-acetylase OafA/YrhL